VTAALSPAVVSITLCVCGHGQHRHGDDGCCTGHLGDCACTRFDMADPVVVDIRDGLPRQGAASLYSTVQLCDLTGATFRQIDYWTRTNRLNPTIPAIGSGSQRRYGANDVRLTYAVVQLLEHGFTLDQAFTVAHAVAEQGRWASTAGRSSIAVTDGSGR
jgi:hypothetical protein